MRQIFGLSRPFTHLTILGCVAALSPCARVPVISDRYKSAERLPGSSRSVSRVGYLDCAPLIWTAPPFYAFDDSRMRGGAFPLRQCSCGSRYKSAAANAKVTECGTGRRTPNRGSEPKLNHYPSLSTGSFLRAIMLALTLQNPMVDSEESMQKGRE